MIVGGQTKARAQLSSTIIDYHEPFDQGLRLKVNHRSIYSRILGRVCAVAMATGLAKNKG